MVDAAAAAAMSDPERNPKFRRQWQDPPREPRRTPPANLEPKDAVELTGRELLEEWRRERAHRKRSGDVNARTGATPDAAAATAPTYDFTFGVHNQTAPWTDVRTLSWAGLVDVLTRHEAGPKKGTCLAPAVFRGELRRKEYARRIDVALLDCDAGATLAEIRDAIARRGWAAVVSSTHSHLSTRTRARRADWVRFRAAAGGRRGDRPSPAPSCSGKRASCRGRGGRQGGGGDRRARRLRASPLPEVPRRRPAAAPLAGGGPRRPAPGRRRLEGAIGALAAALGLHHDQACTDTSRLFFLPRRPPDGPPPETAVLEGVPCDLFALACGPTRQALPPRSRRRGAGRRVEHTDPDTGEAFDLTAWARRCGGRLRARRGAAGPQPGCSPARRWTASTTSGAPTRRPTPKRARTPRPSSWTPAGPRRACSSSTAGTPTAGAAASWPSCDRCWSSGGSPSPTWTIRGSWPAPAGAGR